MSAFGNDDSSGSFFGRIKKGVTDTVKPAQEALKNIARNGGATPKAHNTHTDSHISSSSTSLSASDASKQPVNNAFKLSQFKSILGQETVDLKSLKKQSWNGIPHELRPEVWQLLLGYMPANLERRESAIARKRKEYLDSIPMYFNIAEADRTTQEGEILRQIDVDLPRTCPNNPFFSQPPIQKAMERILYIWAIRHPASGYVQGMNDLLTPLLLIAIQPFVADPMRCDVQSLPPTTLMNVEADSYWCFTKLLDNIQDHYTFSQPGLQRMVHRLEDLIHRIDNELYLHFQNEGVMYVQFSFRWMNCALLRELPLRAIMRLWDTYFAEEKSGFENFHVYVCAVLLKTFRDKLLTMQFQDILMFLQDLPTTEWDEVDIEPILSQAYILSTLFDNSPNHLN